MTSFEDDVPSLPTGAIIGAKYRLIRALGRGSSGAVYEAQGPDGQRVAVKTVLNRSDSGPESQRLSRFLRESRLASQLSSPHIVPVLDGGVDEAARVVFTVMPLLRGEDAASLLHRVGPLHPIAAVRIAIQACSGLSVAHAAGVVHRDLKPSNLFLDAEGNGFSVKICDFGVAKSSSSTLNLTAPGTPLGSPLYMAPEQLLDAKDVDARADLWALAMTLFELLAGAPAYKGVVSASELVLRVSTRPIPLLQDAAPWIDPALAAIVHGALLPDREARCPSAEAFAQALAPHAAGAPSLTPTILKPVSAEQKAIVARKHAPVTSWASAVSLLSETAAAATGAGSSQSGDRRSSGPRASVSSDPQEMVGQVLGDRYRLLRMIGKGGMGAVFEGADIKEEGDRRMAIKVVLGADHDAEALRRFVREAKASRELSSEHVVRVLDAETDLERNIPFIVMELLQGCDLDQLVKQHGPLEPSAACQVFLQACKGLAAAHQKGVVHRDIKPANLFLHQLEDGRLVVKVCDFGVAKQTGLDTSQTSELTQTGGLVGSPMYMSPEQAKSAKHVDHRTDIWSLAISLHQALSGQKPWAQSGSLGELILAICTADIDPLQDAAPWIPPALADVVHRGILREPGERYQTIDDFARALEPFALPADKLTQQALTSLSESKRQVVAPRATGFGASRSSSIAASTVPSTRRGRGPLLPIAVFAGIAGVGITGVVALRASTQPAPATTIVQREIVTIVSAAPSAAPSATAAVSGKLAIKGTPTRISVNGSPRELSAAGDITLEGSPGDVFFVELEAGKIKRGPDKVTLSRDGSLSPSELSIVGAPVAPASGLPGPGKPTGDHAKPPSPAPAPAPAPGPQGTVKPREEF